MMSVLHTRSGLNLTFNVVTWQIHQHFDLNGVDAKEPYYPPAKSLGSNLLPLLREDHRHQNLLSDAVISHPIPLVYQAGNMLVFLNLQDILNTINSGRRRPFCSSSRHRGSHGA